MKKTFAVALASAAALAAIGGGVAYAQAPERPAPRADMTRAQVEQRTAEAFDRMDANKDGVLNQADREAHKAQRQERRAERLKARFDQFDADKNGSISRTEFEAGHDKAREKFAERGWHGKRGGHRGHRMGGGFGGPGPFAGPAGGPPPGSEAAPPPAPGQHPGPFKADGKQSVTKAEFTAAALERFDRADANKDGAIGAEERREAFKAFRGERRPGPPPPPKQS